MKKDLLTKNRMRRMAAFLSLIMVLDLLQPTYAAAFSDSASGIVANAEVVPEEGDSREVETVAVETAKETSEGISEEAGETVEEADETSGAEETPDNPEDMDREENGRSADDSTLDADRDVSESDETGDRTGGETDDETGDGTGDETGGETDGETDGEFVVGCSAETPETTIAESAASYILQTFVGDYYTESMDKLLTAVNEIRESACKSGAINPATGEKLTMADYKPLVWCTQMEEIARLRAAESCVYINGKGLRTNNLSFSSAKTSNGMSSYAESIAINYNESGSKYGIMRGIEQWAACAEAYLKDASAKNTKSYRNIISTEYTGIGIGCYKLSTGSQYAVIAEFTKEPVTNQTKDTFSGREAVELEIASGFVKSFELQGSVLPYMKVGQTKTISMKVTSEFPYMDSENISYTGVMRGSSEYLSQAEGIATISDRGVITAVAPGTAQLQLVIGKNSWKMNLLVFEEDAGKIQLLLPSKRTYFVGEKLSVSGGKLININTGTQTALSSNQVSGFSSATPGRKTLLVTSGSDHFSYEILVLEKPTLQALEGNTVADVALPSVTETAPGGGFAIIGTWSFDCASTLPVGEVGVSEWKLSFIVANDYRALFTDRRAVVLNLQVSRLLEPNRFYVNATSQSFVYDGLPQEADPVVRYGSLKLVRGRDYEIEYSDNIHAGTAKMVIHGRGDYTGTITGEENERLAGALKYEILPAEVTLKPTLSFADKREISELTTYEAVAEAVRSKVVVTYLVGGKTGKLTAEELTQIGLHVSVDAVAENEYCITLTGAIVSNPDYAYIMESLVLALTDEPVTAKVTLINKYDSESVRYINNVVIGGLLAEPTVADTPGLVFNGWFKDSNGTKRWNFETDVVAGDMTLYALWRSEEGLLTVSEVGDMVYTGAKLRPSVTVYDGTVKLKEKRDYTVSYRNNTNRYTLREGQTGFDASKAPAVIIKGKGNYSGTVTVYFVIEPRRIGNDEGEVAAGIKLSYKSQLAYSGRRQKVFTSVAYKSELVQDTDYVYSVTALRAFDAEGYLIDEGTLMNSGAIPAKYMGTFLLTVTGYGNYTGTITKEITVSASKYLLSKATVTIGQNLSAQRYDGSAKTLVPAVYDAKKKLYYRVENGAVTEQTVSGKNCYTVSLGGAYLVEGHDFNVAYANNSATGTASATLTGRGMYRGSKTVTFAIEGCKLDKKSVTVRGLATNVVYTGSAARQKLTGDDAVQVIYHEGKSDEKVLVYGRDYTVKYSGITGVGTAKITFVGIAAAGFRGSVTKSYTITGANIGESSRISCSLTLDGNVTEVTELAVIDAAYSPTGAKPTGSLALYDSVTGKNLVAGTDYTVSYARNKKCYAYSPSDEEFSAAAAPCVKFTGKGKYSGTKIVYFRIGQKNVSELSVTVSGIGFNSAKNGSYQYKPEVTVKCGSRKLTSQQVKIRYVANSQTEVKAYLEKLESGIAQEEIPEGERPHVVISAVSGNYSGEQVVFFTPYRKKLTAENTYIIVPNEVYTGAAVTAQPTVYYGSARKIAAAKKAKVTDPEVLETRYELQILSNEANGGCDYSVSCNSQTKAGAASGKIIGRAPYFGGSVSFSFTINKRGIR